MFRTKLNQLITQAFQKGYDEGIASGCEYGFKMGQIDKRNKEWVSQSSGLTLAEKQALVILEREGF